ncbi:MAG: hypothetical protein HY268_20630 [Deltaproteobacteria bacterium]|nr:hypothetical protein [Deltaproteobacteria bacterium]
MLQRAAHLQLPTSFQRETTKALAALHNEIAQREQELAALKTEASRWQSVLQGPARKAGRAVTSPQVRPSRRPRLDWSVVLQELPARFTIKDLAQKTGKPIAHVYVYASRWMKDKKVRKVKDGYQKVSQAG